MSFSSLDRTSRNQNIDLTFKFNKGLGRHGWLRLTPAYSVKLVDQILDNHDSGIKVLDPFCGTGTTVLSAVYRDEVATASRRVADRGGIGQVG